MKDNLFITLPTEFEAFLTSLRSFTSDHLRYGNKEELNINNSYNYNDINKNKEIESFDSIMYEDIKALPDDYLKEDMDNIIIVHKNNTNNNNNYFVTKRSYILYNYKDAKIYPCGEALRMGTVNPDIHLFDFRMLGFVNTSYPFCDISALMKNPFHQIFILKKTNQRFPAFASEKVKFSGSSAISGLHCQEDEKFCK